MATFSSWAPSPTRSLKLRKQSQAALQSPARSEQTLYWPRQETKPSKVAAWGSRQCQACSARAPLSELCKASQGPPRRAATAQPLLLEIRRQNGHVITYWQDHLGCRGVVIFPQHQVRSLTLQPACKVKSRVKLHSIYETLRGRKSIVSHWEPLFTVSYAKPLLLPGWVIVPVGTSSALCSPKHYVVKLRSTKTNYDFIFFLYPHTQMVYQYPHLSCNNYTIPFVDNPVFGIWICIIFSKFTVKKRKTVR